MIVEIVPQLRPLMKASDPNFCYFVSEAFGVHYYQTNRLHGKVDGPGWSSFNSWGLQQALTTIRQNGFCEPPRDEDTEWAWAIADRLNEQIRRTWVRRERRHHWLSINVNQNGTGLPVA